MLVACGGAPGSSDAGTAASAGTPTSEPGGAAGSDDAETIDHPTGATDVVLRVGEEGGFMMMEHVMARMPRFTLYGDGRVLIAQDPVGKEPAPVNGLPAQVLRETRLTEPQVQDVVRFALIEGRVGVAKEEFPVLVMDAPTAVIELHAGGVDKRVKVAGLTLEGQPGPDAAILRALASFVDRVLTIPVDSDFVATASVAILAETEAAPGVTPQAWPWPDQRPAAFVKPAPDDPFGFKKHVLSADEAAAIGVAPGAAGGPLTLAGPDDRTYLVVLRPALPEETAGG